MDHPLKEFLDAGGDSVAAFARRIGVDAALLERVLAGEDWPDPFLARRIVEATDGAVSFSALYGGASEIADLGARGAEAALDEAIIAQALYDCLQDALGGDSGLAWSAEIDMAAEAVANTYAALARVTTRQGLKDRVAQALRPVLAEILRDYAATVPSPSRLEQTAQCLAERYCEAASRPSPR